MRLHDAANAHAPHPPLPFPSNTMLPNSAMYRNITYRYCRWCPLPMSALPYGMSATTNAMLLLTNVITRYNAGHTPRGGGYDTEILGVGNPLVCYVVRLDTPKLAGTNGVLVGGY